MQRIEIKNVIDKEKKKEIAVEILKDLPDWFGLPDSTREYVEKSQNMPFWVAEEQGRVVGFIVCKETSPDTAEIYVMGVKQQYHRGGIGRQLFGVFHTYAKEQGYSFLQVKTVQEGHYEEYDRTNAFYKRMGFKELECFPTLWDEWNPCQILIRGVESDGGVS